MKLTPGSLSHFTSSALLCPAFFGRRELLGAETSVATSTQRGRSLRPPRRGPRASRPAGAFGFGSLSSTSQTLSSSEADPQTPKGRALWGPVAGGAFCKVISLGQRPRKSAASL